MQNGIGRRRSIASSTGRELPLPAERGPAKLMIHRIVFLDRGTIDEAVALGRPRFAHEWVEFVRTRPEEVRDRLRGATIAITNKVALRRSLLEALPDLRLIVVAATGTDVIDLECCAERGIVVSNVRGYATVSVAEHTFALILALRRALIGYRQDVANGAWGAAGQFCFFSHALHELRGARLGIAGAGAIGQQVGALGRAFSMDVVFAGRKGDRVPRAERVPWEVVLETSDVLSLHMPLNAETRGLIGADELRRMRPGALLVNTSRGGLVEESALANALRAGEIAGAAIDAVSVEPPPPGHVYYDLLDLPNFLLTPHVAWASREAMRRLGEEVLENLESFERGAPRNRVMP